MEEPPDEPIETPLGRPSTIVRVVRGRLRTGIGQINLVQLGHFRPFHRLFRGQRLAVAVLREDGLLGARGEVGRIVEEVVGVDGIDLPGIVRKVILGYVAVGVLGGVVVLRTDLRFAVPEVPFAVLLEEGGLLLLLGLRFLWFFLCWLGFFFGRFFHDRLFRLLWFWLFRRRLLRLFGIVGRSRNDIGRLWHRLQRRLRQAIGIGRQSATSVLLDLLLAAHNKQDRQTQQKEQGGQQAGFAPASRGGLGRRRLRRGRQCLGTDGSVGRNPPTIPGTIPARRCAILIPKRRHASRRRTRVGRRIGRRHRRGRAGRRCRGRSRQRLQFFHFEAHAM
mmetsp:Transcript_34751/g.102137  ORF Transcript_34751/g.102137 Transcript_34751/m.102137 type:complete len:334 (-) Transcript_34751:95-1096(-)